MNTILAIDIGNTNLTLGLFRNGRLRKKSSIPTEKLSKYGPSIKAIIASSNLKPSEVEGVIVSSVVPKALYKIKMILNKIFKCKKFILGENVKVPIRNLYKRPEQVGQDRLVNAVAAKELYGVPALVIDFGTAITFDIVSKKGEYLGGLILPGIELSLSSLYYRTALLPKIRLKPTSNIIGKGTADSMRAGILFGFGAMCDGLIGDYRKIFGRRLKVITTGGSAHLIKKHARSIQIVDHDLILKGLKAILDQL